MRATAKTRVGIRALFDLAFHARGQSVQAREIALRQRVSLRFLEQALFDLRHAGLVTGRRGRSGGYSLARPAAQITLGQAVRATEGALEALFDEDEARPRRGRPRRPSEPAAPAAPGRDVPDLILKEIAGRMAAALDGVTVQDLVARAEALGIKRGTAKATMYFI